MTIFQYAHLEGTRKYVGPLLIIMLMFTGIQGNSQMPKVFTDADSVELIDPLKGGFQVVLTNHFIKHSLHPGRLPTLFLSAIPLNPKRPSSRRMYYGEEFTRESILLLKDLSPSTWYYVCVEFENVIRKNNRGNTSTDCRLARTLDQFGKKADSLISDISVADIGSEYLEFRLSVDTDAIGRLTAFLEAGSCPVQSFMLSEPRTLRLRFSDLSPGFNYGKLCILFEPLTETYSMMGRTIHANKQECHLGDLVTKSRSTNYGTSQEQAETSHINSRKGRAQSLNAVPSTSSAVRSKFATNQLHLPFFARLVNGFLLVGVMIGSYFIG